MPFEEVLNAVSRIRAPLSQAEQDLHSQVAAALEAARAHGAERRA